MIGLYQTFESFLFGPVNAASLPIFRFFFGAVIVVDAYHFALHAPHAFGTKGYLPNGVKYKRKRLDLLSPLASSDKAMRLFFAVMGVAGFCLAAGIAVKFSALVVFVTLASALARNPHIHHSGRVLAVIWAFLLMFTGDESQTVRSDVAFQLLRIQLCLLYFMAVLHKSEHKSWFDGSMMYKVLSGTSENRSGIAMPSIMTYRAISSLSTWATVGCQAFAPFLLWNQPTYWIGAVALWGLHIGMQIFLSISTFQFYLMCGPLLFLPM
jgi:hypothetical protein